MYECEVTTVIRICFVILISLPIVIFYLCKVTYIEKHDKRYTEEERYAVARRAVSILQRNGRIHTDVYKFCFLLPTSSLLSQIPGYKWTSFHLLIHSASVSALPVISCDSAQDQTLLSRLLTSCNSMKLLY